MTIFYTFSNLKTKFKYMLPPTFDWVYREKNDKPKKKACPYCKGSGIDSIFRSKLCSRCGGSGFIPQ